MEAPAQDVLVVSLVESSRAHGVAHRGHRLRDVLASGVREADVEHGAAPSWCHVAAMTRAGGALEARGEEVELAEDLNADARVLMASLVAIVQAALGELEQERHLRVAAPEVVRAERVHAQAPHAEGEAPLEDLQELVRAVRVAEPRRRLRDRAKRRLPSITMATCAGTGPPERSTAATPRRNQAPGTTGRSTRGRG